MPSSDRDQRGGERQLERRRQALHDELDGGDVVDERVAQVAVEPRARGTWRTAIAERLVEAERGGRARALGVVGLRG